MKLLCLLLLLPTLALAQIQPTDPPFLSRYAGAVLQNTASEPFASLRVPASSGKFGKDDKLGFAQATPVEGQVGAWSYLAPKERGGLEVFRNYQAALAKGGFTPLYACELAECDKALIREHYVNEVVRTRKWKAGRDPSSGLSRDLRFLSAKLTRNGADVFVMLFVAEPNSSTQAPSVVVLVAEPKPMEGDKVLVDADAIRSALAADGRIALYGIHFDTGLAVVKPDSKPQLDEMAKLLAANPALKVYVVGHTDDQGVPEANLTLSQRRAEAVAAALTSGYGVAAGRLQARGVASWSPVASNRDEAGRARNRRVEMVERP